MTSNRSRLRLFRPVAGLAATPRRTISRRTYALLGFASFSGAGLAICAPKPSTGTRAWTSGPQTTIRVRPDNNTPCVAKVGRQMPVWVWGKYQGWYRVETHDHIFGWVSHQNLNLANDRKVENFSTFKANLASNRTGNQVMFGTPQMLRAYYNRYKASGAVKGLALQGIYLSSKPKTRLAAKGNAHAAPRIVVASAIKPRPLNSSGTLMAPPTREELTAKPQKPVEIVAPTILQMPSTLAATLRAKTERSALTFPALSQVANATITPHTLAPKVATVAPVVVAPIIRPMAITPLRKAPAKVTAAPKKPAKKLTWRQKRYQARLNAKKQAREKIRANMGWSAQSLKAPATIAPFAPEDLLKAREAYLQAQRNRSNASNAAPAQATPQTSFNSNAQLAPAPPTNFQPSSSSGTAPLTRELQTLIFGSDNQRQLAVQTISQLDAPAKSAAAPSKPASQFDSKPLYPVIITSAKKVTRSGQLQGFSRGGSPTRALAPSRGGSPTDRAVQAWRSGMASQALSYRGMPYRYGAASPKRGFDCSGLIYFLLRQRGYNPPRTAAGYRNYGQAVARGQWKTGDLILFANTYKRGISHIGVYLKDGKFVHAATSGTGVRVDALSGYYAKKYYGARRVK